MFIKQYIRHLLGSNLLLINEEKAKQKRMIILLREVLSGHVNMLCFNSIQVLENEGTGCSFDKCGSNIKINHNILRMHNRPLYKIPTR
jgi:hypothetical protein